MSSGSEVQFFAGIPFAKPPVGNLRFEKPEPVEPWNGTLEAVSFGKQCIQFSGMEEGEMLEISSEDCLTMNIARPSTPSDDPLGYPVVVFIYGGGFSTGSSNFYHTVDANERIATRGIILVTFNYRLGPFGFYTTNDERAPGNYGLWDQVQALKFVQEVIADFGGNPGQVTIFGASAGGGSTSWLTFSKAAKGLFKRAMPLCGTAQSFWARNVQGNTRSSERLEERLNCDQKENPKNCLKRKTVEEILKVDPGILILPDTINFLSWSPQPDGEVVPFEDFSEALKQVKKTDSLYGINSQEDLSFTLDSGFLKDLAKYFPVQVSNASEFSRSEMEAGMDFLSEMEVGMDFLLRENGAFGTKASEAIRRIVAFYETEADKYSHHAFLQAYAQFFSDIHFNVAFRRETRLKSAANHGKVFVYLHDYVAPKNKNEFIDGSGHCMEISYLFGNIFFTEELDDPGYRKSMNQVLDLFESFVKTGIPRTSQFELPKVTAENVPFLHISSESKLEADLFADREQFWDKIVTDFGFDWITNRRVNSSIKDEL
uniref:Carboxylic ester hydrolase n=1 Tax=Panagrolaimus sp. JU765 TaxID=591449 RepID=A0AC34QLE0_9BILA